MEGVTKTLVMLFIHISISSSDRRQLDREFYWETFKFDLGSAEKEAEMTASGEYIEDQAIPVSFERWEDKMFIATPRLREGIPSTLNYFNVTDALEMELPRPMLIPYPNLRMHNLSVGVMTSIVSVRLDRCNRLWALDSGTVNHTRRTPPAIHVINPLTDRIIRTKRLRPGIDFDPESDVSNVVVDVTSADCTDAYAYISDHVKHKLIIYNWRADRSHRISHSFFYSDPLFVELVDDEARSMEAPRGIYSLALSHVERDEHRRLFFSPFASGTQFIVNTKVLRNRTINVKQEGVYEFKIMGSRSPASQSAASVFDEETGVLFYTLTSRNALGCWNYYKGNEFKEKTQWSVKGRSQEFIFPIDVRVDKMGFVWLLCNNYMEYVLNTTQLDFTNIEIFRARTREAISDTACDI